MSILVVSATTGQKEATNIKISLNGNLLSFNNSTGIPYLNKDNRVMMPLREILEKLNHKIEWNGTNQSISIDNKLHLKINDLNLKTNTSTIPMDTAPVLRPDGKTYLPLRYVLENLGNDYKVEYEGPKSSNQYNHTVNIIKGNATQPVEGAYVHPGYLEFERDLKDDKALENYLKDKNGDSYSLERFYMEAGRKGPTAPIFFIHEEKDGQKVWELTIRQYNGYSDQLEYLLKNIAGNEAGTNIWNWFQRNDSEDVDLNPNTWIKMSDKIEFYYDDNSGSNVFYIRNIQ